MKRTGWHAPCMLRRSHTWCGRHIKMRAGIYAIYRNGVLVYVGSSARVRARVGRGHHVIARLLLEGAEIGVKVRYATLADARTREAHLIARLAPEFNHSGVTHGWETEKRRIIRQELIAPVTPVSWPPILAYVKPTEEEIRETRAALYALFQAD